MAYLIDRPSSRSFWNRIYLPAILKGMWITGRHFLKSFFRIGKPMTVEYPEQKRPLPVGYRSEHRLTVRASGDVRCTACMLCATICPADCITIEAEAVDDPAIEKRAARYVIDELRCVYCGLCVEACPCDAIRMDTGRMDATSFDRSSLLYNDEHLIKNGPENTPALSRALY